METEKIIKFLQEKIHTVIVATIDEKNLPVTCAIDLMLIENKKLYFLTARGKSFFQRLMNQKYIALTGMSGQNTMSTIAISLKGKIRNIGHDKLDKIFEINSYMKEIYPDEKSRDVLEVFELYEFDGEYFDLSQKPIYRKSFSIGKEIEKGGYYVTDRCIGCKSCYKVCPQKCIDILSIQAVIEQSHCLHCGMCEEICPVKAIKYINN